MRAIHKGLLASGLILGVCVAAGLWIYDIRMIQPHRVDIEEILNTADVNDRTPSAAVRTGIAEVNPGMLRLRFRVARQLVAQFIPGAQPGDWRTAAHTALWGTLIGFHRSTEDLIGMYCTLTLHGCGGETRSLELHPCNLTGVYTPARCGTVDVLENPQRPEGRHLSISLAVLPATESLAQPDPIVVLMGGPGEDAISAAADLAQQFDSLHKDHDLLLVDQRGTGRSGALHCDLFSADDPAISLRDLFPVAAVKSCAQRLSLQADLTQYSYAHFANDLEQIRRALGYGPLDLFAGSYGTRAAQVFIRNYPNSVRTVYLGSVVPVDVASPGPFAAVSQAALQKTFDACRADPNCRSAFPNLRSEFADVIARLDSGQARVLIPGSTVTATLDRGRVAEWLRSKLYRPRTAADLPWLIHQAYNGNWGSIRDGILTGARAIDSELSFGLLFSITCSDDVPFLTDQDTGPGVQATFLRDYRVRQQQAACEVWPKAPAATVNRLPVHSNVPAMFVSGDSDGGTPLSFMERVAPDFTQHLMLIEQNQGHTEWNSCVSEKYEQFVRQGSVAGIRTDDCTPQPRPAFKTN